MIPVYSSVNEITNSKLFSLTFSSAHRTMISRDQIYVSDGDERVTFKNDDNLPNLPLPSLNDTLQRYYEALKPFGTDEELKNSLKIIENFKNGVGPQLHKVLEQKARVEKNWVS
jgi:carnitine O-octanoyltransferase